MGHTITCFFLVVLVIFPVFGKVHVVGIENRDALTDLLNGTVECIRENLETGNPDYGIPSLNPLLVDDLHLTFDEDFLRGDLDVDGLRLTGVTNFALTTLDVVVASGNTYDVSLTLLFHEIDLSTLYKSAVSLFGMISIPGDGNLDLDLDDILITAQLNLDATTFDIDLQTLTLKLGNYGFEITGLLGDPKMNLLVQTQVKNIIDQFIRENGDTIDLGEILDGLDLSSLLGDDDSDGSDDNLLAFLLFCLPIPI